MSTRPQSLVAKAPDQIPVGAILLGGALLFAVLRQGAYHEWQHQIFALLVGLAAAAIATSSPGRAALRGAAVIVAPLLGSTLISLVLSHDRSDAASTFGEIAMVGVGLAGGSIVSKQHRDTAINAIVFLGLVVAATAIWGVATHTEPWGRSTEGVWRGSSSLTYANAAASVSGPLAILTFILAAARSSRVYAVTTVFLLIGFASTQSRGGAIALVLVALPTVKLLGMRRTAATALPTLLGLVVGTPLLLASAPTDAPVRVTVVTALIVAGVTLTYVIWQCRDQIPNPAPLLGVIMVAMIVTGVATGLTDPITERLTLRSGTTAQGQDAEVLFGDRAKEWSTAWERFADRPIVGHGPGVVDLHWVEDGKQLHALFVHNEYLELLVTHGVLGILALTATTTIFIRRARINSQTWPMLIALLAYSLHAAVDFLWHLPALPVLYAVVAGLALEDTSVQGSQRLTESH